MDLDDVLERLFKYELSAALACVFTPVLLFLFDGARSSLSDYAYSNIDFLYVFLLTVSATLITTIGVRRNQILTWVLGLLLMLIPLTPYKDVPILHTAVSILFFVGMSYHIIRYSDTFKRFRWFLFGIIALVFGLYYVAGLCSLFVVESVALMIFGTNFIVDLIGDKGEL